MKKGALRAQALMVRRALARAPRAADSLWFYIVSAALIITNFYLLACPPHWG